MGLLRGESTTLASANRSNTQVISVLREVAQQLKFLKTVAEAEVVEKLR